jgi:hypothetical protein
MAFRQKNSADANNPDRYLIPINAYLPVLLFPLRERLGMESGEASSL